MSDAAWDRDWSRFEAETANQLHVARAALALWRLEVISTRCAWSLWPTAATRQAYVVALAARERGGATLLALEGFSRPSDDLTGCD